MPYKPESYRLIDHPDIGDILEAAARRADDGEGPIFVPCPSQKAAVSMRFRCQRYRKAFEVQHRSSEVVDALKYSWLHFEVAKKFDQWGVIVSETRPITPKILDLETGNTIEDRQDDDHVDI